MVPSGDRSVESLQTVQRTILFADVSNSTRIYEALGDTHALSVVSHLLGQLEQCVAKQAGSVVKTMGDAMVCAFEDPDAALHAACDMMALLAPLPARPYGKLSIQIGLTCGPVVLTEGDVFGDTVNVCARLVALANAEQVLTSQQTVDALTPALRARCRTLFPVQITKIMAPTMKSRTTFWACFEGAATLGFLVFDFEFLIGNLSIKN